MFLWCSASLSAQGPSGIEAQVRGKVVDKRGEPVMLAEVSLRGLGRRVQTDSLGEFRLGNVGGGETVIDVRRIGFVPASLQVARTVAGYEMVRLTLDDAPLPLGVMTVLGSRPRGLEDFERRRRNGVGVFITRDEIEERHASRLSDIVRSLPGVRIDRRGARGATLRFSSSVNDRRDCTPQLWVDGQLARGADIDDFPPGDVEAIELYSGPAKTPMQFAGLQAVRNCGTVVIWSRQPG